MSTRKAKPFIATSVTPVPAMPPPLVLPSEIRRSSVAPGSRSRSASSSRVPSSANFSKPQPIVISAPQAAKQSYNPYTSPSASATNLSNVRPRTPTGKSLYSSSPAPQNIAAPRSKSMTSASLVGLPQNHQSNQKSKPAPPPEAPKKTSLGQKLRNVFSFGKKNEVPRAEKSDRTFSLSFSKKGRASTMNAAIAPPAAKPQKQSRRSMTMTTNQRADYSSKRTSTMTAAVVPPTFEGFDSNFVDNPKKRKSSRPKVVDDDAASVRSNSSVSSFATLKKMGTSFSKGTKSLFNKNGKDVIAAPAAKPVHTKSSSTSMSHFKPIESQPRTYSLVLSPITAPLAAEVDRPPSFSFASSTSNDLSAPAVTLPPTPTRTDTDSIITDAASTIKVSNNSSSDDILTLPVESESSDDDLNLADTVFPKNLDPSTVESIRSSLDRTKSLERRRSRRSNKSSRSTQSGDTEKHAGTLEVHISSQDIALSVPSSLGASPHGILKHADAPASREGSLPDGGEPEPEEIVAAVRSRNSLKPSTSIASIFDFGDSDINLDLNFDFAPAAAAGLETEAKKYKSSLKSKPKDYSLTETRIQQSYQQTYSETNPATVPSTNTNKPHHHHNHHHHSKSPSFYHPLHQTPGRPSASGNSPAYRRHHATGSTSSTHSSLQSSSLSLSLSPSPPPGGVSFSSRILIYDTYDAIDYDRRADIATCNRLNPMLAQQIKEELNNFKMEMEVHVDSRIYTHFY